MGRGGERKGRGKRGKARNEDREKRWRERGRAEGVRVGGREEA